MIYFFYGEDNYRIREKEKALREAFLAKAGSDLNLVIFDGEDLKFEQFFQATMSMPFMGEKKLTVVRNIFDNSDKEIRKRIAESIKKIPDFSTVLFIEEKAPDRRETLFKTLNKKEIGFYFPLLEPLKLKNWIRDKLTEFKINIDNRASDKLSLFVGPDLWRMNLEIEKLVARAKSREKNEISEADVVELVEPKFEAKIFDLTDALADKNLKKTLHLIHQFLTNGEDESYIFNMIVYQFRTLLLVADADANGSKLKLHPFVIQKSRNALRKISFSKLVDFYWRLYQIDSEVKQGRANFGLSIELLIVDFCK